MVGVEKAGQASEVLATGLYETRVRTTNCRPIRAQADDPTMTYKFSQFPSCVTPWITQAAGRVTFVLQNTSKYLYIYHHVGSISSMRARLFHLRRSRGHF